jgi:hypothetical protein
MLTGISDRQELTGRFGTPDSTFHYEVSSAQVRGERTMARQIFDQKWIESTLLGLAVAAGVVSILQYAILMSWVIVCAAFLYRCFKAGHTLLVLARCYRQMLEEGRAKLRYIKGQAG